MNPKRTPKPADRKPKTAKTLQTATGDGAKQARRERRRDLSREEIIGAARRVLLREGIGATTLDVVARDAGLSKAALYYYFPSKDALLFELVFGTLEDSAHRVAQSVGKTQRGGEALRAIVHEMVTRFAPQLDDFRLAFLAGQVAGQGALNFDDKQFARIRPLNDLCLGGAAKRLSHDQKQRPSRARVEPRLMAFLAYVASLGLLTMKGMVESVKDPLLYSDEQLIEGMARIFDAAAAAD